ncbi:hypothetical protein PCASD_18602 [Puccinia coronata f. sp. avenae]|uniref:Uncharacterized protein n=1 Tax=Puccinia coronata f. sp. avenae TaxID=200324 RepID=A0A2N5TA73_9BASI|nr:hypothetical protein PCASD_18602 [Puccinia coronata f. sp. avenae]
MARICGTMACGSRSMAYAGGSRRSIWKDVDPTSAGDPSPSRTSIRKRGTRHSHPDTRTLKLPGPDGAKQKQARGPTPIQGPAAQPKATKPTAHCARRTNPRPTQCVHATSTAADAADCAQQPETSKNTKT